MKPVRLLYPLILDMTIESSSLFNDPPITATRVYAGEVRITDDLIFWNKITGVIKAQIHADDGNLHFDVAGDEKLQIKSDGEFLMDGYIKSVNASFSIATDELVFRDSALNQLGYIDSAGVIHGLTLNLSSQLPIININSGTNGTLDNNRLNTQRPFTRLYINGLSPSTYAYFQSDAFAFMDINYNDYCYISEIDGLSINNISPFSGTDVAINNNLKVDVIKPNATTKIQLGSSASFSPYINDTNYELHVGVVKARITNLNFHAENFNVLPLAGGASKFSVDGFGKVNATDGSGIQNLNASYIASGTINNARLPTTPTFNGINFNTLGSTDWAKFYTEGTEDDDQNNLEHRLILELGDDAEPAQFIIRRYSDNLEMLKLASQTGDLIISGAVDATAIGASISLTTPTTTTTTLNVDNIVSKTGSTINIDSGDTLVVNKIKAHTNQLYYNADTHTFTSTSGGSTHGTLNSTGLVVGVVANQFGHKLNVVGSSYFNGVVNVQKYLRANGVEFELSANGNGTNPFKIALDGTCFLTGTEAIKGASPLLQSSTSANYFRPLSDGNNYSDSINLYIRDLGGATTATFDNVNNRVGINTTPAYTLDVRGQLNIRLNDTSHGFRTWGDGSVADLYLVGTTNSVVNNPYMRWYPSAGTGSTHGRVVLWGWTSEADFCLGDGKLGIGTETPTYDLTIRPADFEGISVASDSGDNLGIQLLKGNGDGATTSTINGVLQSWYGIGLRCKLDNTIRHTFNTRNGDAYFAGNLGIGTTAPAKRLEIQSTGSDHLRLQYSTGFFWDINRNNDGGKLYFASENGTKMVLTPAGNLGLGTTNPIFKLDVNGSARLLGYLKASSFTNQTEGVFSCENGQFLTIEAFDYTNENKRPVCLNPYGGNVGVGVNKTSPLARLEVSAGSNGTTFAAARYFRHDINYSAGSSEFFGNVSIFADDDIISKQYIASHAGVMSASDERIKENIEDISDTEALDKLRLLKPKTYTYKDTIGRGSEKVIGFIAQEVEQVLPLATGKRYDTIPNIYELANVSASNVITFTNFNTSNMSANTLIDVKTETSGDMRLTIEEVIDEHSIKVKEDVDGEQIFVMGEYVDDFTFLKKDHIWTIATSALQEVDRQQQADKERIATLEAQVNNLIQIVNELREANTSTST